MDDMHSGGRQDQGSSSEKLVLPAYHRDIQPPSADAQTTFMSDNPAANSNMASPEQLIPRSQQGRRNAFQRFIHLVRTDPAYQVLVVAIVLVLISGGVLAAFASSFLSGAGSNNGPSGRPNGGAVANVQSTPTTQPTQAPTPTPSPTAPPPTPTAVMRGPLTVRIISIPQRVTNNTSVPVIIQTSQPGVMVRLVAMYGAPPGFFMSDPQTTANDGTATLTWNVNLKMFTARTTARVAVAGQNQDGQQVQSQPVTVRVNR